MVAQVVLWEGLMNPRRRGGSSGNSLGGRGGLCKIFDLFRYDKFVSDLPNNVKFAQSVPVTILRHNIEAVM